VLGYSKACLIWSFEERSVPIMASLTRAGSSRIWRLGSSMSWPSSGVVAIVLGPALQNTLADVFSGLAINIERPFGAGDWIILSDQVSGQVMRVNWRATRLRTWSHDMVIIPNSVVSKTIVTNHSRPKGLHRCIIRLKVDLKVTTSRVIEALTAAATGSPNVAQGTFVQAYACAFSDSLMDYELAFAINSFALTPIARSEMLGRISDSLRGLGIDIGAPAIDVRIIHPGTQDGAEYKPHKTALAEVDSLRNETINSEKLKIENNDYL
jgi:small-conductance mechanosensitive channel